MGRTNVPISVSPLSRLWKLVSTSVLRYNEIDGEQRAASFAYYAFFSLFPLIVLLVTTVGGSLLKDQAAAASTVTLLLQQYIPLFPADQTAILATINGFIAGRGSAGVVAFLTLAWSSLRFFQALVHGVNRAWGTREHAWWHLPIKNLGMVALFASGLVLGGVLPAVLSVVRGYAPQKMWVVPMVFNVALSAVPFAILFYVILIFYKYAPRGQVSIRDTLFPALSVTVMLKLVQYLFAIYLRSYSNFHIIYGTFAGVIALMLWIYITGSLLIFGGCLCAVGKELRVAYPPRRRKRSP